MTSSLPVTIARSSAKVSGSGTPIDTWLTELEATYSCPQSSTKRICRRAVRSAVSLAEMLQRKTPASSESEQSVIHSGIVPSGFTAQASTRSNSDGGRLVAIPNRLLPPTG